MSTARTSGLLFVTTYATGLRLNLNKYFLKAIDMMVINPLLSLCRYHNHYHCDILDTLTHFLGGNSTSRVL